MPRVQKTKTQLLAEIERLTARVRELESPSKENAANQSSAPKSSDTYSPLDRRYEEESLTSRLRESEEHYRKIAEGLPQIIWMTSPDSQEVYYVSPAFERVLQRPVEEIYRDPQTWFKSVHPDDRFSTEKIFRRCRQGELVESEYRIVRPSGEIRWIRDRAFPILNDRGEFTRIGGIAEDTTESKQAERERQALQQLSRRLTASLTLEQLGEAVAQESRSLFHHDAFLLLIIDKKEGLARDIYAEDTYDGDQEPRRIPAALIHPWDSRKYTSILRGKPVLLNRKRLPVRSRLSPFGDTARLSRSLMFCPVRWENQTVGILSVQSYTSERYRKSDMQLLGIFADHVGGAMARTLMEESLREAHDRLEERVEERTRELALANRKLEESREQMQAVLDTLPGCMMWVDSTLQILGVNRYLAELLGHPPEFFIGKKVDAIASEPAPRGRITRFFASSDEGKPQEITFRRNGQARQFWAVGRKYRQGQQAVFVGIEITERKQAEEKLKQSEENFRTFFETLDDLIFIADRDGRILFTNQAALKKLGYSREEFQQMHLLSVHPERTRAEAERLFEEICRGQRHSCPLPLITKNGRLMHAETRTWLGRWGGIDCVYGITKDLTQQQAALDKFNKIFESTPAPMALHSMDTRKLTEVNSAFLKKLGYTREEIIGKTATELGVFVHVKQQQAAVEQLRLTGRLADFEMKVKAKDGTILDGIFYGEVIENPEGPSALTLMMDITERKQMEKALQESEDKLAGIVDSITDHMSMMDEEHTIVWANGVARRLFGPDLIGKRCYTAYHGRDRVCDRCIVGQTFSDGLSHEHQTEVIDQEGNIVYFWCTSNVAARNEEGRPTLVVEVSRDMTERRLAALALEQSEHKYRMLFEEAKDGIFINSREGKILEANPALLEMFGIAKDNLAQHGAGDFYANVQDREKFRREVEAKGSVKDFEIRMKRRDGAVIPCLISAALWRTPDGSVGGYQGMIRDISRQKQAEEDKRRMEQMRRDFVANVSHEFKTPLTAIRGYAETLLDKNLEDRETALRFLGVILNQSIRLQRLTNNLLKLSQLDEGSLDIEFQAVDIPVLIGFCLETVRIKAEAKDLSIQSDIPASLPQVHGDAWWLRQVFQNIMDNAVEYSVPGGRITVWARDCGEEVEVTVSDTGIGIRKEMLPRIFERFYRGDASRSSRGGGTGLGLAIVKELVRVHNGRIQVDSQPGRGTSFSVFFPQVGRDFAERSE